ncbi:MAG TPA: thioredoxin domain-containing protein, partial [Pirellulales bacterium]|nr:thioredoxin domain-containing protein [Pirellulales bacterium]
MWRISSVLCATCLFWFAAGAALAQDQMQWQPNLETAQRLAAQSKRLVLVHFWAPWCRPCRQLEQTVFAQPDTSKALEANFVLVKLNVDESPATARMYYVSSLPTDVIITPAGKLVAALPSPLTAPQYIAAMNQAAEGHRRLAANAAPTAPGMQSTFSPYGGQLTAAATASPGAPGQQGPAEQAPAQQAAMQQAGMQQPPGGTVQPVAATAVATAAQPIAATQPMTPGQPMAPTQPAMQNQNVGYSPDPARQAAMQAKAGEPGASPVIAPPADLPPGTPAVGLDGCCPVTLVEQKRWAKGDPQFGVIHRGRTYLFASAEAQRRFWANPDAFSPVIEGNDPVLALDNRQMVPGTRTFGVFYEKRIYLFS